MFSLVYESNFEKVALNISLFFQWFKLDLQSVSDNLKCLTLQCFTLTLIGAMITTLSNTVFSFSPSFEKQNTDLCEHSRGIFHDPLYHPEHTVIIF